MGNRTRVRALPSTRPSDKKLQKALRGFQFFQEKAHSGEGFTLKELMDDTGWEESSARTYRGKQWGDVVEVVVRSSSPMKEVWRIRREFLRLTQDEFLDHITQRRPLYTRYHRTAFPALLTFEFLLPLTRESQLRAALDELFYRDTIRTRLQEIGLKQLSVFEPQADQEGDDAYLDRMVEFTNRFFGYSVSHVDGRFRACSELLTRVEAAKQTTDGGRYLIDETTAVVRFVLPLSSASYTFSDSLSVPMDLDVTVRDQDAIQHEADLLRKMFFLLFVEAIVRTIRGEDEIWLLERGLSDRLYKWSAS